jgi:hypothetical protein
VNGTKERGDPGTVASEMSIPLAMRLSMSKP